MILSQKDQPQTHRSTRQISRETGIARSSVVRIIKRDVGLKCLKRRRTQELTEANRHARLIRSRQLLQRYSPSDVSFIWFTDEKFFTIATPKNPQNDRLYAPAATKKKYVGAKRLLSVVADGVSRRVEAGLHRLDICRSWCEDKWSILSGSASVTTVAACHTSCLW